MNSHANALCEIEALSDLEKSFNRDVYSKLHGNNDKYWSKVKEFLN